MPVSSAKGQVRLYFGKERLQFQGKIIPLIRDAVGEAAGSHKMPFGVLRLITTAKIGMAGDEAMEAGRNVSWTCTAGDGG